MMASFILEISLIIGIAAVLALVGRIIRQPLIIAYLITGILVGPLFFDFLQSPELIEIFAHMGVAFLLFIVGLNLDFRVLKEVGSVSLVVGIGQIILTASIGFAIAVGIGFSYIPALFLAAALAFSSTVVVVKLLSDKNELDTLHGKISIGILIVQDFIAAIALIVVPALSGGGTVESILLHLGKAALFIIGVFVFAYIFFPRILSLAAKNQEILFLFSVGWALIVSVVFSLFGFSLELGALLAGMALATSRYNLEIKSKIEGLRDLFVVMFFVFFGSQLSGEITGQLLIQAGIFSLLVLIGNPLIVMALMRLEGYKKRTNFFTGLTIAQISEFSLILLLIGFNLGLLDQYLLSLGILIALITIALSSYGITYSQQLFKVLSPLLGIFDGKRKESLQFIKKGRDYDVILVGYNRIGYTLLKAFEKAKKKYLIIDHNPETIMKLSRKGIDCVYGDANDAEFLNSMPLSKARIIVSTIPELDTNLVVLSHIKNKKKTLFIPISHHISDTKKLYAEGADYVIMPHFLGGDYVAHMLLKDNFNKKTIINEGKKQYKEMNERLMEGHAHPRKDFYGK